MTCHLQHLDKRSAAIRWLPGVDFYGSAKLTCTHSHRRDQKISRLSRNALLDLIQAANLDIKVYRATIKLVSLHLEGGIIGFDTHARLVNDLKDHIAEDGRLIRLCETALMTV